MNKKEKVVAEWKYKFSRIQLFNFVYAEFRDISENLFHRDSNFLKLIK